MQAYCRTDLVALDLITGFLANRFLCSLVSVLLVLFHSVVSL